MVGDKSSIGICVAFVSVLGVQPSSVFLRLFPHRPSLCRSSKGSPKVVDSKVDPNGSASMGNGFSGQLRKESLVIEDYYCVSVEPPDARAEPELLLADVRDGSREQQADAEDPTPAQGSSFLSEGEGPAQWLAAPKVDLNPGDTLSMESAEDTSDSEGEWNRRRPRSLSGVVSYEVRSTVVLFCCLGCYLKSQTTMYAIANKRCSGKARIESLS